MALESRVTNEMNGDLLREFSMVEVDTTLKQTHPLKSLGPDGILPVSIKMHGQQFAVRYAR